MKNKILIMLTGILFWGIIGTTQSTSAIESNMTVYYFWNKPKCISCIKIKEYTKEAIDELNNKNIEYKVIDFTQPKNKNYAKKYGLYTKTVILSKTSKGNEIKHKNLSQIWMKLNNKKAFKQYIKDEIQKFNN